MNKGGITWREILPFGYNISSEEGRDLPSTLWS